MWVSGLPFSLFLQAKSPAGGGMDAVGICVKHEENYFFLRFDQIIYLAACGRRTVIYSTRGEFVLPRLLGDLSRRLPDNPFMKVHRSYIVNVRWIRCLRPTERGDCIVEMDDTDDSTIPVSRKHAIALKQKLRIL